MKSIDDGVVQDVLNRERWVCIMCDYSAEGVWDKDGRCCEADSLPVPHAIRVMLQGWQEWYEFRQCPITGEMFDVRAHSMFGLFIARLVKLNLPDWTVVYHDGAALEFYADQPGAQHLYEYEIIITDKNRVRT